MKTRIVAGLIVASLATALVFAGPGWSLSVVAFACALLSYREFSRLFFPERPKNRQLRIVPFILAAMICLEWSPYLSWIFLWMPFLVLGLPGLRRANRSGDFRGAVFDVAIDLMGFVYIVSLVGFLKPIAMVGPYGRSYLYLLFMIVFGGDTFAYFGGVLFGRHKLASRLSPKKSWEGAVAGLCGALLFTLIWLFVLYPGEMNSGFLWRLFLAVPLVSILAMAGDLFESLLKRSQSQKDSGQLIPGHGGILDRIDGLAFAAPVFYLYLILCLQKS